MTEPPQPRRITRPSRILVAEDDDAMRDLLVGWLHEAGYDVTCCNCGLDLQAQLERSVLSAEIFEFDVVLSDIRMPLGSALDVLDQFLGCDGLPPTILITAFADPRVYALATELGVAAVLEKPFDKDRLIRELGRIGEQIPGTDRTPPEEAPP
jgi:two-component system response regulator HydG